MHRIKSAVVISLDTDQGPRFTHALHEVRKAVGPEVPIDRFPGVDVRKTSSLQNAAEYGCSMAHLHAIESIANSTAASDRTWSCIFEDDVQFTHTQSLEDLLQKHPLPEDAHVLQLGFIDWENDKGPDGYLPGLRLGAHAYCMDGSGARSLHDHLKQQWPEYCDRDLFSGPPIDKAWMHLPNAYLLVDRQNPEMGRRHKKINLNASGIFAQRRDDNVFKSLIQGRRYRQLK